MVDPNQLFDELLPYFNATTKMNRVLAQDCPNNVDLNMPPVAYRSLPYPLHERRYTEINGLFSTRYIDNRTYT